MKDLSFDINKMMAQKNKAVKGLTAGVEGLLKKNKVCLTQPCLQVDTCSYLTEGPCQMGHGWSLPWFIWHLCVSYKPGMLHIDRNTDLIAKHCQSAKGARSVRCPQQKVAAFMKTNWVWVTSIFPLRAVAARGRDLPLVVFWNLLIFWSNMCHTPDCMGCAILYHAMAC